MNWKKQIQNSVARRLALLSLFGLAAVLVAVGAALDVIEHRSSHALMVTSSAQRVQSMVDEASGEMSNTGQAVSIFKLNTHPA